MKKIFFTFFTMILLLTGGCYDANEPNNIAYVVALGIDKTEEKNIYEYTIQFAKTTQISGGSSEEGGKEGSNIVEVINVKAPTICSGINMANQSVSKTFTLAHTKLIVISEDIARSGVRDIFDTFGRNSDIRPDIYLSVARGTAKDYLDAVKPIAEVNPVTYYRLIYQSEHGGYVPRTILRDFYFQLDGAEKQSVLPLAGVNEENKKKAESEKKSSGGSDSGGEQSEGNESEGDKENKDKAKINEEGFDFLMKEYVAGNMDVSKRNPSEVMGMAIFKNDKMIAMTDNIDSLIYNLITGHFKISYTSFYNENSPNIPTTVSLEQTKSPQIRVKTDGDNPKIKIKISLEGELVSESMDAPVEDDIEGLERNIEKDTREYILNFLKKTTQEYDSDIIGFGQYAKMNFLNYADFVNYDWQDKYKNSEFEVEVEYTLQQVGFVDLSRKKTNF